MEKVQLAHCILHVDQESMTRHRADSIYLLIISQFFFVFVFLAAEKQDHELN